MVQLPLPPQSGELHKLTQEEMFLHKVSTNGSPSEEEASSFSLSYRTKTSSIVSFTHRKTLLIENPTETKWNSKNNNLGLTFCCFNSANPGPVEINNEFIALDAAFFPIVLSQSESPQRCVPWRKTARLCWVCRDSSQLRAASCTANWANWANWLTATRSSNLR